MLVDNLVNFSRSPDVIYAIDAKAGNGRLLSPIRENPNRLAQDTSASSFEERQGFLRNSGVVVENGEWVSQGYTQTYVKTKLCTAINLKGRSTSFTIICKGTLRNGDNTAWGMLYCQGATSTTYCPMIVLMCNTNGQLHYGCSFLHEDGTTSRQTAYSSYLTEYLGSEHIYIQVVDFENRLTKLYIDGEWKFNSTIPDTAISISLESTSSTTMSSDEYLNLFVGNEYAGTSIGDKTSSVSYLALVDRAMTAEELKVLA